MIGRRTSSVSLSRAAAAGLAVAVLPCLAAAQPLTQCEPGSPVADSRGARLGQIVGVSGSRCLVKSPDGRMQSWIPLSELSAAPPETPEPAENPADPPAAGKAEGAAPSEAPAASSPDQPKQ